MSVNLIDLIKGQLGQATVSQAAATLGESESGVAKAISAFLPAVVGSFANNSNNSVLTDLLSGNSFQSLLGNLTGTAGTGTESVITSLLHSIFGDKISGLISSVAAFAGVSNSSSSSLLNMVTSATAGTVGQYASENNLNIGAIQNLLTDQKGAVSALLPAGLSLASLGLGTWGEKEDLHASTAATGNLSGITEKVTDTDQPKVEVTRGGSAHATTTPPDSGGSIWKWILPLLLLALAAWFMMKQCDKKEETTTTTMVEDNSNGSAEDSEVTVSTTKTDEDIDLNGSVLRGYKGGMEDNMISFLKAGSYEKAADDAALKDNWYTFDKVNFKMGSSTELEDGSLVQLENLLAILKAYPEAKVKIGGYTDKTGDAAVNKTISQQRADYIKKWLSDKGVGSQVLAAEGYGSEFATVDASASDEDRAIDRKMAVRFAK